MNLPLFVLPLIFAPYVAAQTPAPSAARSLVNALNPKLSASADFLVVSGPNRQTTDAQLRELELAVQADVDPKIRADIFIAKPNGEAVEVEEAYATLHTLPFGLQARAGKLRPVFGRMNILHTHELPQVDRPLALDAFLGEEGLGSVGAEAGRIFAPLGVFTEVTYAFLRDLGEAEEAEPATTQVNDVNGNPVTVKVEREGPAASRRFRDFAHVGRVRLYKDLTDAANLELGVSGAIHQPREAGHRKLAGADLTFRWKPLQEGLYRSFAWRTEWLLSVRSIPDEIDPVTKAQLAPADRTDRRGGYSYAEYQWSRHWRGGLRGDYSESATTLPTRTVTRAVSPYLTYTVSEFNRVRLQLQRRWNPSRSSDNRVTFQWTFLIGPHGAHAY